MATRTTAVRRTNGKRIALLALAATSLASAVAPAATQASFPGQNGLIVFTSNRDGDNEIFSMTPAGNTVTQLTSNAASDQDPELSADGAKIVFTSNRDGDNEVFVMNLDGTGQTQLTTNTAVDQDPAFSPSGTQIAFRTDRDGNNEIYSMTSAGASQTNLTANAFSDFNPDWAPDGTTIAFQRFDGTIGNEIYSMTSAGGSQTRLTNNAVAFNDGAPSWAPDGSSIAFHSNRDGDFEIFTMTPAGASQTQRTTNTNLDQKPAWSPDGQRFAFFSDRDGNNEIYTATAPAAGSQTRVTNNAASDQTPAWANDSVPPDTTINTGQADGSFTSDNTPTFTFTSSELNSTFECQVDGGGFSACTSPFTTAALGEGSHTVQVRALDVAGNADPLPASRTFTVDTIAPDTTIQTQPANPTNQTTATFTFNSNESPNVTFECQIDGGGFSACTSGQTYPGLVDGSHTFQVRATDQALNTDASPASYTWTIDTAQPETSLDVTPSNPSNDPSPTFEFSSTSPDLNFFECKLDGGAFTACTSPQTYPSVGDGVHDFSVRAVDTAGNRDATPADFNWVIDTGAPETTIDLGPDALTLDTSATFTFSSNESPSTFECQIDGGGFLPCTSGETYSDLTEGSHTFEVQATDEAGNTDQTPDSQTWEVVTDDPDTTIDSGPDDPTDSTDAEFTFSGTIPGANTFECKLDDGAFEACASPYEYENVAEGSHTVQVRATDTFGRTDATPAEYTWEVDLTEPNTTFDSVPPDNSPTGSVSLSFSSDEAGSTFECSVNNSAFSPCASPLSLSGLPDGNYTVAVRATDPAGNVETTPAVDTFKVDTVDPETTIDVQPPDPSNSNDPSFEFSSNEGPNVTFECQIDSGGFTACTSPQAYTDLSEGSHTFEVRATDLAGNTDPTPASYEWTVDTIAPVVEITSAPTGTIATDQADIEFTVDDGTATVECSLDGGSFAPCSSPQSFPGLTEGSHTIVVRATDAATNAGSDSATFSVDTIDPETTIDTAPPALSNSATAAFSFSSDESPDVTFECQIDSGGFTLCTSPQSYPGLGEGSHTFEVRAIDDAGNTDQTPDSHTWTVDTTPPDTTITDSPPNPSASASASFEFNSADLDVASFQCSLDGAGFTACTSPQTYSSLSDASHNFQVRAVDNAGNPDPTPASYTWTVDTTGPVTTIDVRPDDPTNSADVSYEFSSEAGATFECQIDGGGYTPCTSPQPYTGLGEGNHTFDVRAIDTLNNTGAPVSDTFEVDLTAPPTTINSGPPAQSISTSAAFTFSSTDPSATFECRIDGGGFTACTSPKNYTGLSQGSHTFEVRATDDADNTDATPDSRTFNVDTVPPIVNITGGPSGTTSQQTANFTFNVSGATTIECKLDGGAFAACTSPKSYPGLADGQHTFTVRASDAAGNTAADSRTWTVDSGAPDTTITVKPAAATESASASFEFVSTEPGSTFSCRLDGGAFAACTSPKAYAGLAPGAHTFEVRATDAGGATDLSPATHTWTIAAPPAQPAPAAVTPVITLSKKVKSKGRTISLGSASCGSAACRLVSATATIGGAACPVTLGPDGKITCKLSKESHGKFRLAGKGTITVTVTVASADGTQATATGKVKLRAKKKKA